MKTPLTFFFCLCLSLLYHFCWAGETNSIRWVDDFEEAKALSLSEDKPLLLYFSESDWNPVCMTFEEDILNTEVFAEKAADKFVFVQVDFPKEKELAPERISLNSRLKKKYRVRKFPNMVILDEKQNKLAARSYLPVTAEKYASHLLSIVDTYRSFIDGVQNLSNNTLGAKALKKLYKQAKRFKRIDEKDRILETGLQQEDNLFFLSEKYSLLIDAGKFFDKETVAIREALLAKDPENKKGKHLYVALIDFQELSEKLEEGTAPYKILAPLLSYIEKFGDTDKKNAWRIKMTVAQFLFSQDLVSDALEYAHASYNTAPEPRKASIQEAIDHMTAQMGTGQAKG